MKQFLITFLLFATFSWSQVKSPPLLEQAYSAYLELSYAKAEQLYQEVLLENPLEIQAVYGIYNCRMAVGDYKGALAVLEGQEKVFKTDLIFTRKLLYVLAVLDYHHDADQVYRQLVQRLKDQGTTALSEIHRNVLSEKASGFLAGGDFRGAKQVVEKGLQTFPEDLNFKNQLLQIQEAKSKSNIAWNNQVGLIKYSPNTYYQHGWFSASNLDLGINANHELHGSLTYTNLKMKNAFTFYEVVSDPNEFFTEDNLPLSESRLLDTVEANGITYYYPYEIYYYAAQNTEGTRSFFKTPVKDLYSWEYLLGYSNLNDWIAHTRLAFYAKYFQSNMIYATKVYSGIFSHTSSSRYWQWGAYYSYSALDAFDIYQWSPEIHLKWSDFKIGVRSNLIQSSMDLNPLNISNLQNSWDFMSQWNISKIRLSLQYNIGDRAYLTDHDSHQMNTMTTPLNYSASTLIEYFPLTNSPLTLYYLGKVNKYQNLSNYVHMTGVYYKW